MYGFDFDALGQRGQKGQNVECSPRSLLSAVPEAFCRQIISGMFLVNVQKQRAKKRTRAFLTHACVFVILLCDTWLPHLFHPKTVAPRFLAFAEFCMLGGVSHVEAPPHLRV